VGSQLIQIDATPPPPSDWTFCANEWERCSFTGTQEVRYGANGTFTAPRTFTDGVECTNAVFGDPLPGVLKRCERRAPSSSPPPPPPPPSNQPPTVSLTSPANGASFTAPARIPLAATAADPDGSVARVEFFNGATKLSEDTSAPYTGQWNTGAAGTYTLTARATDNSGETATSSPVTITVKKKR
jgi:Bacterial Ig domain